MSMYVRKLLSVALIALAVCCGLCLGTEDAYAVSDGWRQCGTYVECKFTDGELVIRPLDNAAEADWNVSLSSCYNTECNPSTIRSIHFEGTLHKSSVSGLFAGCTALESVDLTGLDTSTVTDMSGMFNGCSSLKNVDISQLNIDKVYNFNSTFAGCTSLESIDLSFFKTSSSYVQMINMFNGCTSLKEVKTEGADFTKVEYMQNMFTGCSSLETINLSNQTWGAYGSFYANDMFAGCSALRSVDFSGGKFVDYTYLNNMFVACSSLKQADFSGIEIVDSNPNSDGSLDTKNMFAGCSSLEQVSFAGLSAPNNHGWYTSTINSSATDQMFVGCTALKLVDFSNISFPGDVNGSGNGVYFNKLFADKKLLENVNFEGADLSNVREMNYMFEGCESLETLDLSNQNLIYTYLTAREICKGCTALKSVDFSNSKFSNADFTRAFAGCTLLKSFDFSNSICCDEVEQAYNLRFEETFASCSSLKNVNFKGSDLHGLLSARKMFVSCTSLEEIDFSNVNMYNDTHRTYTQNMFSGCTALKSANFSGCTFNNTDSKEMFTGCPSLKTADFSNCKFGDEYFTNMFAGDSALEYVTFAHSEIRNGLYANYMFAGCSSLKTADLNFASMGNRYNIISDMFIGCSNLQTANLDGWRAYGDRTFEACNSLSKVTLDDDYRFVEYSYRSELPEPPATVGEETGMWIREDGAYGPYSAADLADNYSPEMAGTWIWYTAYTISFDANGGTGSMANVKQPTVSAYSIPEDSAFYRKGYVFDGWSLTPGGEKITSIAANTYADNDEVTLYALWADDSGFTSNGAGEFEFDLEAGAKMWFGNVPAGTSYKVYEETPTGWVLVDMHDANGVIEPNQEAAASFTNSYEPTETSAVITGKKLVDGIATGSAGYKFELRDSNGQVVKTCTTGADGTISFGPIPYTTAGEYTYSIAEVTGTDDTLDYDSHTDTVTVKVTSADGALSATVEYDDDGVVFNNTHKDGMLRIMKIVQGALAGEQPDTFSVDVTLKDKQGNPVTEGVDVQKAADVPGKK